MVNSCMASSHLSQLHTNKQKEYVKYQHKANIGSYISYTEKLALFSLQALFFHVSEQMIIKLLLQKITQNFSLIQFNSVSEQIHWQIWLMTKMQNILKLAI